MKHDHFLLDILRSPESDEPRLVYADFLEERGDPRGEFIRIQCDLARGNLPMAQQIELQVREAELLRTHGPPWRAKLPEADFRVQFRRGFLAHLEIDAETLLAHHRALFQAAPLLRSLSVTTTDDLFHQVTRLPEMANIVDLAIRGPLHVPILPQTSAARWWEAVVRLQLFNSNLNVEAARDLAGAEGFRQVRSLSIEQIRLGDEGAQEIAAIRSMPQLQRLSLARTGIGDEGYRALILSQRLSQLTSLNTAFNQIGDQAVQTLAVHSHVRRLRTIDLHGNDITNEGAQALIDSTRLEMLRCLDLRSNPLGNVMKRRLIKRFGKGVRLNL